MAITIEAIVENGLLKPIQALPLKNNARVRITIEPQENWVQESYGICGWKGDTEELRRLALAPDLDLEERS